MLRLAAHELAPDVVVTGDVHTDDSYDDELIAEFGEEEDELNAAAPNARPGPSVRLNLRNADAARRCLEALKRGDVAAAAGSVAYPVALVLSTLITTREEWIGGLRRDALRAAAAHARREGSACIDGACRTSSSASSSSASAFEIAKPLLIYVGLVDRLQLALKPAGGSRGGASARPPPSAPVPVRTGGPGGPFGGGGGGGGGGGAQRSIAHLAADAAAGVTERRGDHPRERGSAADDPEATALLDVLSDVRERLRDVSAVYEFAVDALEWLEDVESAEDATELFDAMGTLGDALSHGAPTADAFLDEAFAL